MGNSQDPGIEHYEVVGELGRGALGVVYRARDTRLGRDVAIKRLHSTAASSGKAGARFMIEARAVARLQHAGIVKVHEVALVGTDPILVMSLVRGGSLADRLSSGPLEERQAAVLAEQLARALDYAHGQKVLHRDIKPANVLLTHEGRAVLTDFGLARDMSDERERLTLSGQLLGTPSYMSPEQAGGRRDVVDGRSDVYSLGATLYEMLTGQPPFDGQTLLALLAAIQYEEPTPPSRLRRGLDSSLEAVCLKCLHKEPSDRYGSAGELAEELQRFLAGDPVQAQRRSPLARFRNSVRRNRRFTLSLALALPLLLLAAGLALPSRRQPVTPAPPTPDPVLRTPETAPPARARPQMSTLLFESRLRRARSLHRGGFSELESSMEAAEICDELLAERPRAPGLKELAVAVHYQVARGCLKQKREDLALSHLRQSIAGDPTHTPSMQLLARVFRRLGRNREAVTTLDRLLQIEHDPLPRVFFDRAAAKYLLRDFAGALADCDQALTREPRESEPRRLRALCLLELGRPADAVGALDALSVLEGDKNPTTLRARAKARLDLGEDEAALLDLDRAIDLARPGGDEHLKALLVRARLLGRAGRIEEAVLDYERCRESPAYRAQARKGLERLRATGR
jgi:serine/threonine protein kinase